MEKKPALPVQVLDKIMDPLNKDKEFGKVRKLLFVLCSQQ